MLGPCLTDAGAIEIWTDEPIHFPMRFLHALFPKAMHVKFPHCFDHDNVESSVYRATFLQKHASEADWKHKVLWAVMRLTAGLHYDMSCGLKFDRAYTFDAPSPWSQYSVEASQLISREAMKATYLGLPAHLRDEVDAKICAASPDPGRGWALLLLFGLNDEARRAYRDSIIRAYREHADTLSSLQLVLKPHPLSRNSQPELLVRELTEALSIPVTLFDSTLNLDILWSIVPAKLVLAGPCGALPIIRRLGTARGVMLREVFEYIVQCYPADRAAYDLLTRDYEIW